MLQFWYRPAWGPRVDEQGAAFRTFLFTDVEGSSRRWEADPAGMSAALAAHDRAVPEALAAHGGAVFSQAGDSFAAVFDRAEDAVAAAVEVQRRLDPGGVRVRIGLHAGPAEERDGMWFGATLNRAARVMGLGSGRQVLLSDVVRCRLPGDVQLRDLGRQRLAGFTQPERLWQLLHPDLPDDFPPLPGLRSDNLPPRTTSFVGRDEELRLLAERLAASRLVTLVGPGGVGKTRLAVETAQALSAEHPDGVRFVDLTTVARGELVVAQVASALGLRLGEGSEPLAALETHLEDRQLLVVLDNCEHVVDDAARIAHRLATSDGRTRVLATSRVRLRVHGEIAFPVGALGTSGADDDAVRLFLDRAAQVDPDLAGEPGAAELAVELCTHLDGMPLAIELAASRAGELPLDVLRDRLADRFRLLDDSAAARDDSRVRSLLATVDWSYDLLSVRAQRVFERLSVFAGSFTLAAAESVVSDAELPAEEVLPAVTELVAASLVQLERRPASSYRLLETFRAYGQQRLAARGELATLRDRHADEVLREIAALSSLPYDRAGATARRAGTRDVVEDVFAALDHLTGQRDLRRLRQAVEDMSELWWEHRTRDAVPFLERAVEACGESFDEDAEAIRGTAALLLFFLSTASRAQPLAEPVVQRHAACGTPPPLTALLALTLGTLRNADPDTAKGYANQLVEQAQASGHPTERLLGIGFGGWVLSTLGDPKRGAELCEEAVRTDNGRTAWSIALSNIYADALFQRGSFEEALAFCRESVEQRFDLTSYGRLMMLRVVAQTHLVTGEAEAARRALGELVGEMVEVGDVSLLPFVLELTAAFLLLHADDARVPARLLSAADRLRGDSYVGAPGELANRAWIQRRVTAALGDGAEAERVRGAGLDRLAALRLAAEALGSG